MLVLGVQGEALRHGLVLAVDRPVADVVEVALEQADLEGAIVDDLPGLLGDEVAEGIDVQLGGHDGPAGDAERLQLGHALHQRLARAAAAEGAQRQQRGHERRQGHDGDDGDQLGIGEGKHSRGPRGGSGVRRPARRREPGLP